MKRFVFLLLLVIALGIAGGCSRSVTAPPPGTTLTTQFTDIEWVHGQYFLLYDPSSGAPLDVRAQDIRLYRDDACGLSPVHRERRRSD